MKGNILSKDKRDNMLFEYFKRNRFAILFLFCSIFALSIYANLSYFFKNNPKQLAFFPPFIEGVNINYNKHLGAEYYFIAQSVVSGKGFSNPFQDVNTGSTAWMPPFYVYILALLIKLFKSQFLVACCVVFLKDLVLILTGLVVYEIAKRTLIKIKAEFILPLYLLFLLSNFKWFFQFTHDAWLLLLFINIIFPLVVFIKGNRISLKIAIAWGVIGGLSMLASPVVGLVWFVLCVINMSAKKNIKQLVLSSVLFFLICTPWFIRNYVVFDKLIFIKSNLLHDAYVFNYETENGYMTESFTYQRIVWTAKDDPNCLYRKVGEVKFMEIYKEKFFHAISQNPYKYISNIKDRLLSALLIYYPHSEQYEKSSLWKTALHALPFVSVLLLIFLKGYTASNYIKVAMMIYLIYLLPYIIVSYYIRYAIPLTPLKVLFSFWGIDLFVARLSKILARNGSNHYSEPMGV